jgi:TPR repeat protein
MYDQGDGVAQDYREAVKWYRLAATQGLVNSYTNLGVMYGLGHGVAQNYVYEHMWLNLAAASFSGDEREKVTSLLDLVSKIMTSAQIEQAQEMARTCQESTLSTAIDGAEFLKSFLFFGNWEQRYVSVALLDSGGHEKT